MDRVLLVGINNYPSAPLRGCVNDVEDVSALIVSKFGIRKEDIVLITDEAATTQCIKDKLAWLAFELHAGDRVLWHYSGHGAQVAEGGTLHDVICPVDFDWSPDRMITDTDLQKILANIAAGAVFNWVSDSCHSGDLAKAIAPLSPTPERYQVPRLFPTPPEMQLRIDALRKQNVCALGMERAIVAHLNGALIAGCKSDETSSDAYIDDRYNGALTYALIHQLSSSEGQNQPLKSLVPMMQKTLTEHHFSQHPQLRGNATITGKSFLHHVEA